jgi:hypothetical protein
MTRHTGLAGFALAAVVALGSFSAATDRPLGPTEAAGAFHGLPAARVSLPLDEAWRIKHLTESLAQSRAAAEKNPLLLADVGYYETELAASRVQSVAAR